MPPSPLACATTACVSSYAQLISHGCVLFSDKLVAMNQNTRLSEVPRGLFYSSRVGKGGWGRGRENKRGTSAMMPGGACKGKGEQDRRKQEGGQQTKGEERRHTTACDSFVAGVGLMGTRKIGGWDCRDHSGLVDRKGCRGQGVGDWWEELS